LGGSVFSLSFGMMLLARHVCAVMIFLFETA